MLGRGTFFVEKAQWKQHRKMLSKIFNFDLVKTAIPKMSQICDNKLAAME
jgi:cytochrome P450